MGNPLRKPLLSNTNKEKRLDYASTYKGKDWKNILFTDEKLFRSAYHSNNTHKQIYYEVGKRPTLPTVGNAFKVMIWGGISWYGKTKLYVMDRNVTAKYYCEMLENHTPKRGIDFFAIGEKYDHGNGRFKNGHGEAVDGDLG